MPNPLTLPIDLNGAAFLGGVVAEDRGMLTAIKSITAGNLTTSFGDNASTEVDVRDVAQMGLWLDITWGSATSVSVEWAPRKAAAGGNYYDLSTAISGGVATCSPLVYTLVAADWVDRSPRILIPCAPDIAGVFRFKGVGTLTTTTVAAYVTRAAMGGA